MLVIPYIEFFHLCLVLQYCSLTTIDLSLNFIEDKGLANLTSVMGSLLRGPQHVNLSNTTITGDTNSRPPHCVSTAISL